jgi:uncharacterized protein YwgA
MASNKLNGADYLLLLLYLEGKKPIKGAIRLTKMMFIFEKEILPELKRTTGLQVDKLPEFFAHKFGPFSKDLYEQVDFFCNLKFIEAKDISVGAEEMAEVDDWNGEWFDFYDMDMPIDLGVCMDSKYMQYKLLDMGESYVIKKILPMLTDVQKEVLGKFKSKIMRTSPKDILRYVYTKYPESAVNSIIKKEVTGE